VPKIVRKLITTLILALPFQGVLSRLLTNRFDLPSWVLLYKEVLVIVISCYFFWQIVNKVIQTKLNLKELLKKTYPLFLYLFLVVWSVFSSFIFNATPVRVFLIGFRFELFWLGFFAVTVSWFQLQGGNFIKNIELESLQKYFSFGFFSVVLFSFISTVFGQANILKLVGFGQENSDLIYASSTCNPIDFGINFCRLSGTFSSPNHFAAYLMLVFPIVFKNTIQYQNKFLKWLIFLSFPILILFSFSRYAWITFVMMLIQLSLVFLITNFKLTALSKYKKLITLTLLLFPIAFSISTNFLPLGKVYQVLPNFLAKPSSSTAHQRKTLASIELLQSADDKFFTGHGLGASGPAADFVYQDLKENILIKKYGYLAFKYYLLPSPYGLTIPENWFLQVLINGGLLYFLVYLFLLILPFWNLLKITLRAKNLSNSTLLFGFLTVIIGSLVLHVFANQTVAIFWTLTWLFLVPLPLKKNFDIE